MTSFNERTIGFRKMTQKSMHFKEWILTSKLMEAHIHYLICYNKDKLIYNKLKNQTLCDKYWKFLLKYLY